MFLRSTCLKSLLDLSYNMRLLISVSNLKRGLSDTGMINIQYYLDRYRISLLFTINGDHLFRPKKIRLCFMSNNSNLLQ